jgi:RNA polymerase sigma-70 factor (ECF subfamily)
MDSQRADRTRLMDRAAGGDEAAFGRLARCTQDGLYRFALAQLLPGADAAEVVQETLVRAWRGLARWRRGADATAWLYGIAMNVVREMRRRRRRDVPVAIDPELLAADEADSAAVDEADLAALAAHLAELPPRQREAVTCRYLRQMSVRQTAEAMGCAEGTVKAAVFAALRSLRASMTSQGDRR